MANSTIACAAKIHPVGDPTLQIQWFKDGVPMQMSSRANTVYRFGFLALDLLGLMESDAGVYTCVVSTSRGTAESSATLSVLRKSRSSSVLKKILIIDMHKLELTMCISMILIVTTTCLLHFQLEKQ